MIAYKMEELLRFLLDQGVEPSIASGHPNIETPLDMLVFWGTLGFGKGLPLLPCLRLLLRNTDEVPYDATPEETVNGDLSRFHGSSEEFSFLQQHVCPSYYGMSQSTRIAVASKAASDVLDADHIPELVQKLGPNPLTAEDLQLQAASQPKHFSTRHVGMSLSNTLLASCSRATTSLRRWTSPASVISEPDHAAAAERPSIRLDEDVPLSPDLKYSVRVGNWQRMKREMRNGPWGFQAANRRPLTDHG